VSREGREARWTREKGVFGKKKYGRYWYKNGNE
jgi:hypothetical protein